MSDIPKRKKTPEEIAALRDKEFAARIPVAPQAEKPQAVAPQRNQPLARPLVLPVKSEKKLKRQRAEPHGTPHVFDGLRPQEAVGVILPSEQVTHAHTALPERKHNEREIMQMRRRDLLQTRPPVARIRTMALHPFLVGVLYAFALTIPFLTFRYWQMEPPKNWLAPGVGCSVLLALSGIIYFNKPRARHHAALICAIALVTLAFCILITLKFPHVP
jgi:hypothetical protein